MAKQNLVSVSIPKEKLTEMQTHVTALQSLLAEYVIALTAKQRHDMLKMNDKTMPFVDKALAYTKTNPEFVPPFMNAPDFQIDYDVMNDLKLVFIPLSQVYSNVRDTVMQAGSEAYDDALTYYKTVKVAAKKNVPNAKPIAEDLGKRFVKATKKEEPLP
jgi:hypothetical protein